MSETEILPPEMASALRDRLRALTPARVGLGRIGVSQRTRDVLAFQAAHAQARDAVHAELQAGTLCQAISAIEGAMSGGPLLTLHSAATDRAAYLQRPDRGRTLDEASRSALSALPKSSFDAVLVIADGLSALAVERHVPPLLAVLLPRLTPLELAPICIVEQGRVAIGDEIGQALGAHIAIVLIGERPGLSSPDSLGAYITWNPKPGRSDAERNCISNIRPEGLGFDEAARQLASLIETARRRQLTGVDLRLDLRLDARSLEGGAS